RTDVWVSSFTRTGVRRPELVSHEIVSPSRRISVMEAMTGQTDSTRGRSHLRVVGDPPATQAHDPIGLEHGTRRVIICASVALFLVLGAFVIISGRGGLSDAA